MSTRPELAPYAAIDTQTKGRVHAEAPAAPRGEFQRDRDRIVHSTAFRRLEYKTQVFVNHEGDHFRTRLTHSLEVAQIGRTIARMLNVNEELTEAVSLAHDLGHTPFGHAGQDALNASMKDHGGFEHNLQSLRVVDRLEQRYAEFDGLNLCFETREGILKHCSLPNARELGELGQRFIDRKQPSLEAQVANRADEIAYNNHDVDDGLRSGLLSIDGLMQSRLFARHHDEVMAKYPQLHGRRKVHEIIRRMINTLILDLVSTTRANLEKSGVKNIEEVRNAQPLVGFSDEVREQQYELKQYLRKNLYQHYQVMRMTSKAARIIQSLFDTFQNEPRLLSPEHQDNVQREGARAIADYIAGMTDRYAMREYRRIFGVEEISI
ncbi:deoxyguanosinetriphosphate triphosphohydrolase [Betaproteobacteria bacterium SCN2]|jgi:dGTPase|nr:deoxyguanosinetriphosphate triphosphohydrolase [Betaproteobacteria bacterium SCN2]